MKNIYLIFFVIIFVASFLRLYHLSSIPASLNPDEAALGYTSYSFLLTGADEHGKMLPLTLQSFGDGKLPGYSYIGVIPIAIFGLNEFSTRLPSAIAGIAGVLLIYYLGFLLFKNKTIAVLSALLFALSPWSIYFSRAAYEVNLATTLFLGGVLCLLMYIENQKKFISLLFLSTVLFACTMFTYHSYILFTPIFVVLMLFVNRKKITINSKVIAAILLFIVFVGISCVNVFFGSQKSSSLYIFNDKNVLYNRVEKLRGDSAPRNQIIERLLYTKYMGVSYQFVQNYVNSFNPSFFFDKGGEKLVHNLGNFGNLYLFDALLLVVGGASLFWHKEVSLYVLGLWLLLSPIPSALTIDSPNSTRLFMLMPLFVLIESYGAYTLLSIFQKPSVVKRSVLLILVCLFLLNVVYFLDDYFVHFNTQRVRFWHYGYKQAVELAKQYSSYNIVMRGPENFPYIYFLFYTKYDPRKFRQEVSYYPPTDEGFLYVKSFGNYSFPDQISYSHLSHQTIYIDDTRLDDKKNSIFLPSGEPVLGYLINK